MKFDFLLVDTPPGWFPTCFVLDLCSWQWILAIVVFTSLTTRGIFAEEPAVDFSRDIRPIPSACLL